MIVRPLDRCAGLAAGGAGRGLRVLRARAASTCARRGGASAAAPAAWRRAVIIAAFVAGRRCRLAALPSAAAGRRSPPSPRMRCEVLSGSTGRWSRCARAPRRPIRRRSRRSCFSEGDHRPRRRHGGARVSAAALRRRASRRPEADRGGDVVKRAAAGAVAGGVAWLLLAAVAGRGMSRAASAARLRAAWSRDRCGQQRRPRPGAAILLALLPLLLLAGAATALAPYYHVLGTDKVGQDVLYLALKSIRTGAGDRHADHAGDAAVRRAARHHRPATSAAGSTT